MVLALNMLREIVDSSMINSVQAYPVFITTRVTYTKISY